MFSYKETPDDPPILGSGSGNASKEDAAGTTKSAAKNYLFGRVLLVEDEIINRLYLRSVLRRWGLIVEEADDGTDALHRATGKEPPDAILMDIGLPKMDGLQATTAIREWESKQTSYHHIPIIAVSAYGQPTDRTAGLGAGADAYIEKPIDEHSLRQVLTEFLHISK